jgi:hypothetical protein
MCLQAQRHALVAITKVLQRAHAHCLSLEVQRGRIVELAVSVLQHTAHSGVTSQSQWRAWCCRALQDAASVDEQCTAKVRSWFGLHPMFKSSPSGRCKSTCINSMQTGIVPCATFRTVPFQQSSSHSFENYPIRTFRALVFSKAHSHGKCFRASVEAAADMDLPIVLSTDIQNCHDYNAFQLPN